MERKAEREQPFEPVKFQDNGHVKVFINTIPDNFEAHWHIPLEVMMPLENGYTVECGGLRREIAEREVALIAPGAVHALEAPAEGRRVFLQADISCFTQIRELDILFSVLPPLTVIGKEAPHPVWREAAETFDRIQKDYFGEYAFSGMAVYAGLFRLLSLAGEMFASPQGEKTGEDRNSRHKYKERFTAVCEYIREHCTEQITLEQTAKVAGFSKYHFARLFKTMTGTTCHNFLLERRILYAKNLLVDFTMPITEVAMRSGFNSLATFNRIFKSQIGCTPSEFRKLGSNSSLS